MAKKEEKTRLVHDVNIWKYSMNDDTRLVRIHEFLHGDYTLEKRSVFVGFLGIDYCVNGLDELKEAVTFLESDSARLFLLEKFEYREGWCTDFIKLVRPFNIAFILDQNFKYDKDENYKKRVRQGDFHPWEIDLCKIAIPYLVGDQKTLLRVVNAGRRKFFRSHGTHSLFVQALPYLSHESLVRGFDFWGWKFPLSRSDERLLPEETIMELMRKNNFEGMFSLHYEQLFQKKNLEEYVESCVDEHHKGWGRSRMKKLRL